MLRSLKYFLEQLYINLARHGLMSIATVSTAIISLLTLGVFIIVMMNIRGFAWQISSRFEIFAFWDYRLGADPDDGPAALLQGRSFSLPELEAEERLWANRVGDLLQSRITGIRCAPRGQWPATEAAGTIQCVREVNYVPKTGGLRDIQKSLNLSDKELDDYVLPSVFPGKFEIRVSHPDFAAQVSEELRSLRLTRDDLEHLFPDAGPAQVDDLFSRVGEYLDVPPIKMGLVDTIANLERIVAIAGLALIALMSVAMLYTIINTIRLTVLARKDDIRIMELMGASQWFIRWPFLLEGVFHGFIGSVVATAFLFLGYSIVAQLMQQRVLFFYLRPPEAVAVWLVAVLPFFGVGIGIIGSFISVQRFFETVDACERTGLRIRGR